MRWIVASLVVVNILSFIYFQLFSEAEPSNAVVSSIPNISLSAAPKEITLLSEVVDESILAVAPPPAPPSRVQELSREPLCTLVGAFKKLLKAEYFVERLQALGLAAEIKDVVVSSDPGYWLHLPPEKSRKEALRRLSELQRRGIDSYVIPSGNLANGISLGMFSNKERADAMKVSISKQGYRPEMVNVPREQKETWVFLPQGEASKISAERWAELLSSEDYIQKRQNLCTDLASS